MLDEYVENLKDIGKFIDKIKAENKQLKDSIEKQKQAHRHDHHYFRADCFLCKLGQEQCEETIAQINKLNDPNPSRAKDLKTGINKS